MSRAGERSCINSTTDSGFSTGSSVMMKDLTVHKNQKITFLMPRHHFIIWISNSNNGIMNSAGHMVDSNVEIRIIESWDCLVFGFCFTDRCYSSFNLSVLYLKCFFKIHFPGKDCCLLIRLKCFLQFASEVQSSSCTAALISSMSAIRFTCIFSMKRDI